MDGTDLKEERYRVVILAIGDNTQAKKEFFCKGVSENYGIPLPLLKKIIDRCPFVFKKRLSPKKAERLAKALQSFGAVVLVEEKREVPVVTLEYRGTPPHRLALESSFLQRTRGGSWNVIGRAKNISGESLRDLWVLMQLFGDLEEFLAFEEVPIPINPLPPGQASPFKGVFEGDLDVKKASILFKDSSGNPLGAVDRRKMREWINVEIGQGRQHVTDEVVEPGRKISLSPGEPDETVHPLEESRKRPLPNLEEAPSKEVSRTHEESEERNGGREERPDTVSLPLWERDVLPESDQSSENGQEIGGNPLDSGPFDSAAPLLEERSDRGEGELPPWLGDFRSAVEKYYQEYQDIFSVWFEDHRKQHGFTGALESLLAILIHSQFDQGRHPEKALENTRMAFPLVLQPKLPLEEIPLLWETEFHSGGQWRELFFRAISTFRQVGDNILEKKRWKAMNLKRQIQIIPYMSDKNSKRAVRWIDQFIPELVQIDFSDAPVFISRGLYRVASRLGVVNPHFDYCRGKDSMGDVKIQSFAQIAFPQDPVRIEEPMTCVGMEDEKGGCCFAIQPRCETCLFETFCPKLHPHFDPAKIGLGEP